MPGTSVPACAPWRRAIRRVTRSVYSSSSLVPRMTCSTMLTAAITSEASSASPKEPMWMSSGNTLSAIRSTRRRRQHQQEARDEHERQAQRGQDRGQDRVEHPDQGGDEERGAGLVELAPGRDPDRHLDRRGRDDPAEQEAHEFDPWGFGLPGRLLAVVVGHGDAASQRASPRGNGACLPVGGEAYLPGGSSSPCSRARATACAREVTPSLR